MSYQVKVAIELNKDGTPALTKGDAYRFSLIVATEIGEPVVTVRGWRMTRTGGIAAPSTQFNGFAYAICKVEDAFMDKLEKAVREQLEALGEKVG